MGVVLLSYTETESVNVNGCVSERGGGRCLDRALALWVHDDRTDEEHGHGKSLLHRTLPDDAVVTPPRARGAHHETA